MNNKNELKVYFQSELNTWILEMWELNKNVESLRRTAPKRTTNSKTFLSYLHVSKFFKELLFFVSTKKNIQWPLETEIRYKCFLPKVFINRF